MPLPRVLAVEWSCINLRTATMHSPMLRGAFFVGLAMALAPSSASAADGSIPGWAASVLFVGAVAIVLALLLREALFDSSTEDQPLPDRPSMLAPQKPYDARQAVSKTAANRRVA